MPTLRAPDGRLYRTEDGAEVINLQFGHGYTLEPDEPDQQPATPRGGRSQPPASPGRADPSTVAGETTR
ncbi:hypothetical protein [Amycolatopsis sp. NPDC059021]|uniref:hypothetical protein n=1 Tax=Amycolatopsis sp. NPDC059021 TaxID=3346704 RepID=UPI00367156FD